MPIRLKPVREQAVVVFGASSGIGRATALRFAQAGAQLVVAGRNGEALASLVHEIEAMGGRAVPIVADAAMFAQVQAVGQAAIDTYGRLDTWAHVAGVGILVKFWDTSPEEFKRVIEVNLCGAAYGAMVALPLLRRNANGGALIQVSSVESQITVPYQSAYAASKHGMKGYLDTLRMELEQDRIPISLTNIMPAAIDTPFFTSARSRIGVEPKAPPPVYQPEAVAEAILQAAHVPARDVVVGAAGHAMLLGQRFAPWLMSKFGALGGAKLQRTDKPKAESAPDNLFTSGPDSHVHGTQTEEGRLRRAREAA